MADRRRVNGPAAVTLPPLYDEDLSPRPTRSRPSNNVRATYLKTGITPSASGSAYLEVEARDGSPGSGMKVTCTVHGPRALPRSAPFSPHVVLSTHVKYAPFATKHRRGYLRDSSERDLSTHLETALRGALIADRWPKSGVDVVVTIIEGDEARQTALDKGSDEWDIMNAFGSCVNVAAAALADAGIDCVDLVSGGVAALVSGKNEGETEIVLDPAPSEHETILAACCVAYLPVRDEVTNLWLKGDVPSTDPSLYRNLVARAVNASKGSNKAITASLNETIAEI
ncbi:Exosome complex component-like protein [Hapsidospora chrysogenum ATCC 11550]|uniref:Exosome complex component-like protein n=1 Tax=Hapsidospora chrysogenum (strain ATCC 11550 / CBS 779.69 / DSM 880 / IAM 14645 / JCM 23072 / IMI 49137) TaxID=857340 RepID=A0A086SYY6_HAPC1|nr:Exosome complex component-like protein [Hapsidospora chrysogenum ATCC 11550]